MGCSIVVSRLILLLELDVRCMSSHVFCMILLNLNLFPVGIFGKVYSTIIFRVKKIYDCILFASEKERSERYIALVDFMRSKDLVMKTLINDVDLLILASTALCSDSQRPVQNFSLLECHCGAQMDTRSLRQKEQKPTRKKFVKFVVIQVLKKQSLHVISVTMLTCINIA